MSFLILPCQTPVATRLNTQLSAGVVRLKIQQLVIARAISGLRIE